MVMENASPLMPLAHERDSMFKPNTQSMAPEDQENITTKWCSTGLHFQAANNYLYPFYIDTADTLVTALIGTKKVNQPSPEQLLEGLHDEDDGNQRGKTLLSKSVSNIW